MAEYQNYRFGWFRG